MITAEIVLTHSLCLKFLGFMTFGEPITHIPDWNYMMDVCEKFDNIYLKHQWDDEIYNHYRGLCDSIDHAITCYDKDLTFKTIQVALNWYYTPQ